MANPVWIDGTTPLNSSNMTLLQTRDEKGAASGYASLDASGFVAATQIPVTLQLRSEKAVANGYASLDAGTKVPLTQIPDLSATYQSLTGKNQPSGYAGLDAASKILAAQIPDLSGVYQSLTGKNQPSGYVGLSASSQIVFQGDAAANLYRGGAGFLRTDGYIQAGVANGTGFLSEGNIWVGHAAGSTGAGGGLVFGSAADTNLYRQGSGLLMTDGGFTTGGGLATRSGYLYFGAAADTTLYRVAASTLQTNGVLVISPDGTTPVGATAGSLVLGDKGGTNFPGTISGGGVLFVSNGGLFFRSSGNIVQLA